MHLYIITRGIKHEVDRFITELQGKYVPFKWRKDGNEPLKDCQVQVAVRPIQLWEIVFPEDQKDVVLNTVLGNGFDNNKRYTQHKKHNKFLFMIRKILGAEKIPEFKKSIILPIYKQGIEIAGIGVKKDYWIKHTGDKEEHIFDPTDDQKKESFEGL